MKIFAILVELGFISNAADLAKVQKDGVDGVLEAIFSVWTEIREEPTFWNKEDGNKIADDRAIALMLTRVVT